MTLVTVDVRGRAPPTRRSAKGGRARKTATLICLLRAAAKSQTETPLRPREESQRLSCDRRPLPSNARTATTRRSARGVHLGHAALPQLEDRSGGGTHLGHAALPPPDFRNRVRQRGDARQNRQPTHRPPEAALATLLRPEDRPGGTCRGHTSDIRSRGIKIDQKKTV